MYARLHFGPSKSFLTERRCRCQKAWNADSVVLALRWIQGNSSIKSVHSVHSVPCCIYHNCIHTRQHNVKEKSNSTAHWTTNCFSSFPCWSGRVTYWNLFLCFRPENWSPKNFTGGSRLCLDTLDWLLSCIKQTVCDKTEKVWKTDRISVYWLREVSTWQQILSVKIRP